MIVESIVREITTGIARAVTGGIDAGRFNVLQVDNSVISAPLRVTQADGTLVSVPKTVIQADGTIVTVS